jgi:hypothetical protein
MGCDYDHGFCSSQPPSTPPDEQGQQQAAVAQQQAQGNRVLGEAEGMNAEVDESEHTATVSYWPTGAGGFGHIGIQVDSDDTKGFSTKDPTLHWWQRLFGAPQARLEDDIAQHTKNGDVAPHSYLHIPVSALQAKMMEVAMENRTENPGRYNLLFNNCADFVESVLHAGRVSGVPHSEIFAAPVLYGILSLEH